MNKTDLVKEIARATNFKIKDVNLTLEAMVSLMQSHLKKGEEISFLNFGIFGTKCYNKESIKNPKTGDVNKVHRPIRPTFRPSMQLKEFLNV